MTTLRSMEIFLEVCRCGCNLSRAAKKLYLSQPAVTLAIKELERDYHVALFDRINRRLCLTEAGKEFLDYCRQAEALFREMDSRMMNWNNEGRLRVGASMTIGCSRIPDYVRRFSARMPGIDVRVQIQSSRILVEDILARELDLAIIETPIHNRNLAVKKLFEDNLDVICPARPPYFADRRITLGELSGFPLLLREHGSGARDILKNVLSQRGLRVEPIWESGVTQALLGAVESGMGVSIIPHIIAEPAIREGRVFRMELTDACLRQNFYLIRLAEKTTTPAMETFMAGVMESCAESGS